MNYENIDIVKIYRSKIDKTFMVFVVNNIFNDDDAVCDLKSKIIISKNFDEDHLLCIESHEISHYIAKHELYDDINSEIEADKMSYIILSIFLKFKSAKIIKNRYENLYEKKMYYLCLRPVLYFRLLKFFFKKLILFEPVS